MSSNRRISIDWKRSADGIDRPCLVGDDAHLRRRLGITELLLSVRRPAVPDWSEAAGALPPIPRVNNAIGWSRCRPTRAGGGWVSSGTGQREDVVDVVSSAEGAAHAAGELDLRHRHHYTDLDDRAYREHSLTLAY